MGHVTNTQFVKFVGVLDKRQYPNVIHTQCRHGHCHGVLHHTLYIVIESVQRGQYFWKQNRHYQTHVCNGVDSVFSLHGLGKLGLYLRVDLRL